MKPSFRRLAALVVMLQLLVPILSRGAAAIDSYPSPSDYNVEKVLHQESWDLFSSMGGFNNIPNATCHDGEIETVVWSDPQGEAYRAYLLTPPDRPNQDRTVTIAYEAWDPDAGMDGLNVTVDTISFGDSGTGDDLYLTAFNSQDNISHIFWERSSVAYDVPEKYWLYREDVNMEGQVLVRGLLFYYEERGTGLPYPPNYTLLIGLGLASVLVVASSSLVVLWLRRRLSRQ